MKVELQTLIDSIQEFLPLSQSLMTDDDLLRFEKISPGCVTFMETQSGDRNFIQSFVTQADISRLSSDCDLVPDVLRISNFSKKNQSMKPTQRRLSPDVTFRPEQRRMRWVMNSFFNRFLISQMVNSSYVKCHHYEDVLYISWEARQYYQGVCPKCIMKIGYSCHRFWKCCKLTMKLRKEFKTITQAYEFVSNSFHFKYCWLKYENVSGVGGSVTCVHWTLHGG